MDSFFLSDTAEQFPDAPALYTGTTCMPYRELEQRVCSTAIYFAELGIQPHDRVAVLAPTSTEYIIALLALLRLGAVAVPISTRFPVQQVHSLLANLHCKTLLTNTPETWNSHLPTIDISTINHTTNSSTSALGYSTPERSATIMCTSGSTGMPKAVLHTLAAHLASARGSQHTIPLAVDDTWLLSLPLYHVGGFAIVVRTLLHGAAMAIPQPDAPLHNALLRFPITHLSLVATQLYRLLQDGTATDALRSLKALLLGGSAMPSALIERARAEGLQAHTSYGCTEMASQITTTRTPEELATSGVLLPYRELEIAPTGEILVRGATLCQGFVHENGIVPAIDNDGWYHTRDIGFLDKDGCMHVTGRIDNMFISGGENIQPEEVEQALCSYPNIVQALVVPIPDVQFGERPVAFLWFAQSAAFNEAALRIFLAEHIARFKIPIRFFVEPPLDDTAGKPSRQAYKQRAMELGGLHN